MTWWSSISSASKLATTALKQAQKKLDKVLDIDEDVPNAQGPSSPLPTGGVFIDLDAGVYQVSTPQSSPPLSGEQEATSNCQINGQRPSSSLSSGPIPESDEVPDQNSSQVGSLPNPPSSVEMSTSGTLAGETSTSSLQLLKQRGLESPMEIEEQEPDLDATQQRIEGDSDHRELGGPSIGLRQPRATEEESGANTTTTSSEIEVISTCNSVYEESTTTVHPHQSGCPPNRPLPISVLPENAYANPDVLYQKLAEATKLLEAREAKLVEICRTNLSLQEVNEFLHTKLEEAGLPHDFKAADLQSLSDEFSERLATVEKKLQVVTRERDQLRSQLAGANIPTEQSLRQAFAERENALRAKCAKLEAGLAEKETQLSDLLAEGHRMAQEQLKANNLAKTLRSKAKTLEAEKQKISNNLTKAQAEIDTLNSTVSTLRENESKLQESLNQVTRKNVKLEKETTALKNELESARTKIEGLNRTRLELESKLSDSAAGLETARWALNEAQTRSEAFRDVEEEQQSLRDEVSTLRAHLEEARLATTRQKIGGEQRIAQMRQEVEHYQEQLAESEKRVQSLSEAATSVAKPLLREIENLQTRLADQERSFETTEQGLLTQVADLKRRLEVAEQTDRQFQDRLNEAQTAAEALRRELTLERENSSRLHERLSKHSLQASVDKSSMENLYYPHELKSELDSLHQQLLAAEEARDSNASALAVEREEVVSLRAELSQLRTELTRTQSKFASAHLSTARASTASPQESRRSCGTRGRSSSSASSNAELDAEASNVQQQGISSPNSIGTAASGQFADCIYYLQSLLRQRDSQLVQMQREVTRLNDQHQSLLAELSEQSDRAERERRRLYTAFHGSEDGFEDKDTSEDSLAHRYEMLLQLYGRQLEENNELKLDLKEAREAYQSQLTELLNKLNEKQ